MPTARRAAVGLPLSRPLTAARSVRHRKELPKNSYGLKHPSQLAPEGRETLYRMLIKGAEGKDARAITFKQFMKVMHDRLARALAAKGRFPGSPDIPGQMKKWREWLNEGQAAAWFMKVGHDDKGRMPIDVFVRRLFTGEAHVMSLEGARDGAFPRDKTRRYQDYLWKWQGMIQKAPRFAKSGVYTPSDWEDYCTKACKILEEEPEAFLKLEHVHGFSGLLNTSNNLFYSKRVKEGNVEYGCLVYYAAAVGIVCSYDKQDPELSKESQDLKRSKSMRSLNSENPDQQQKFFLKHTDDITAITMHPSRKIAASGQKCGPWSAKDAPKDARRSGTSPVFVWDEFTRSGPFGWKKPVQVSLPQKEGLSCMAFSQIGLGRLAPDPGDMLLTVSKDADHTVNLWHWKHDAGENGRFPVLTVPTCSSVGMKGTPPQVYGCAFNPFLGEGNQCHRSTFATWGKMHVTFWHYDEKDSGKQADPYDEFSGPERSADQYGNVRPSVRAEISGKPAMMTTPGTSTANAEKQDALCLCYLPMNMVLIGGPNGSITVLAHPEARDDGLTAQQQANQRKALTEKKVNLKKLELRRDLKTVAVQEIQNAHAPAVRIKEGTQEGQWGYKDGGCTSLVLAETWDVVFSGGGDGRIIEWQMSPEGLGEVAGVLSGTPRLKMSAGVDMLTPLREFDARMSDRTGPPRMFIGMDCCDFQVGGSWERRICSGDSENDIWEIVQTASSREDTFAHDGKFSFLLEGQSDAVMGVAPYPATISGEPHTMSQIFCTASEDGNVYVYDADKRRHLRKHEIRRHGGITGTAVPRGTSVGDLLMARACAFSPDGTMLAVATSGVRQKSERVTVTLPEWVTAGEDVWIRVQRQRRGSVLETTAVKEKPEDFESHYVDAFPYKLPRGTRPYMDLAIDVPLSFVKEHGGFGEMCVREDVQEDLGGVVQIWYFGESAAGSTGWGKADDVQNAGYEAPLLLYEDKVSQEAIDVLTFSSDSNMLAAGSHDNFTYVLGKTEDADTAMPWAGGKAWAATEWGTAQEPTFEHVGVCACHSSYIKHVDWSEKDEDTGEYLLQTVCGAYETLFYRPEPSKDRRMHSKMLALANGEVWPVAEQICTNQRDRSWDTWTSTLGFAVMGIWEPDRDGTDINACDRSPLLKGRTMRQVVNPDPELEYKRSEGIPAETELSEEQKAKAIERHHRMGLSRGHIVTANDDGTVGLYHYPSVIESSPHHQFRGHASHVMNVRFLSDARRVVSAGGLDRTTFQWNTHGVTAPSGHFAAAAKVRQSQAHAQDQRASRSLELRKSRSLDASRKSGGVGSSQGARKSTQLRKKEEGESCKKALATHTPTRARSRNCAAQAP